MITDEEVAHLMGELIPQINAAGQQLVLRSIADLMDVIGIVVKPFANAP